MAGFLIWSRFARGSPPPLSIAGGGDVGVSGVYEPVSRRRGVSSRAGRPGLSARGVAGGRPTSCRRGRACWNAPLAGASPRSPPAPRSAAPALRGGLVDGPGQAWRIARSCRTVARTPTLPIVHALCANLKTWINGTFPTRCNPSRHQLPAARGRQPTNRSPSALPDRKAIRCRRRRLPQRSGGV